MTLLKFRCEHCNRKIGVPEEYLGRRVKCPVCKLPTVVVQQDVTTAKRAAIAAYASVPAMEPLATSDLSTFSDFSAALAPAPESAPRTAPPWEPQPAAANRLETFPSETPQRERERAKPHRRRRIAWTIVLCVGFVAITTAVFLVPRPPSSSTLALATPSPSPSPSPLPSIEIPINLTYAQLAKGIGAGFDLQTEQMPDGTRKYTGVNKSVGSVLVLRGQPDDIRHAHIAVVLTPTGRELFSDAAVHKISDEKMTNIDEAEFERATAQMALVLKFLQSVDPAWNVADAWPADQYPAAMSGTATTTKRARNITLTIEGESSADGSLIKVIARPN